MTPSNPAQLFPQSPQSLFQTSSSSILPELQSETITSISPPPVHPQKTASPPTSQRMKQEYFQLPAYPPNSPVSVSFLLPPTSTQHAPLLRTLLTPRHQLHSLILPYTLPLSSLPAPPIIMLTCQCSTILKKKSCFKPPALLFFSSQTSKISPIFTLHSTNFGLLPHTPREIPLAIATSKVLAANLHKHIPDHASLTPLEYHPSASYDHRHSWFSWNLPTQSFPHHTSLLSNYPSSTDIGKST